MQAFVLRSLLLLAFIYSPKLLLAASSGDEVSESQLTGSLGLETLLQAPSEAEASWEALRGSVVILEFWATWCAPCIAEIPALNDLAELFESQPVQFIAVTDEEASLVEGFLKRRPIHTWVGLDTDRSLFDRFGIVGIPSTVVIAPDGKVVAITHPSMLRAEHIEDMLAGKSPALRNWPDEETTSSSKGSGDPQHVDAIPPLVEVTIRPDTTRGGGGRWGKGEIFMDYADLPLILESAHGVSEKRMAILCELPDEHFEVKVKVPTPDHEAAQRLLKESVEMGFGLRSTIQPRPLEVYVLSAGPEIDRLVPTVSTGGSSWGFNKEGLSAINTTMGSLARWLESSILDKPVIDETGLNDHYDIALPWQDSEKRVFDAETLATILPRELGIHLTLEKRTIDMVVIEAEANREAPETPASPSR